MHQIAVKMTAVFCPSLEQTQASHDIFHTQCMISLQPMDSVHFVKGLFFVCLSVGCFLGFFFSKCQINPEKQLNM